MTFDLKEKKVKGKGVFSLFVWLWVVLNAVQMSCDVLCWGYAQTVVKPFVSLQQSERLDEEDKDKRADVTSSPPPSIMNTSNHDNAFSSSAPPSPLLPPVCPPFPDESSRSLQMFCNLMIFFCVQTFPIEAVKKRKKN